MRQMLEDCLKIKFIVTRMLVEIQKNASAFQIQLGLRPQWKWDTEVLYLSVFHSRLCDNYEPLIGLSNARWQQSY